MDIEILSDKLETRIWGRRKLGIVSSLMISVVLFIMSLPFINWIYLSNPGGIVNTLSIDLLSVEIYRQYSTMLFLSFVQDSGAGILGFPTFILTIICVVALVLQLYYIFLCLSGKTSNRGWLKTYSVGKAANIMSFLGSFGTIVFIIYANFHICSGAFRPTIFVYLIAILTIINYSLIKVLENKEREIYNEHGFIEEVKRNWIFFIFLIPCFIYLLINNYLPMAGIYFAFTQFDFHNGLFASPFVGLDNFQYLFKSNLLILTRNTIVYNIAFITIGNILQIFFAILVSRVSLKWFKKTSQTLIFIPYFVSYIILRVLVYSVLEYDYGMINNLITSLGGEKLDFYNMPSYWPVFIIIAYIWKNIGYGMIIYFAAIMGISDEYYEAARVDGANIFKQIRYITLPLLKPTFIILFLYSIGSIMKGQFELFYQMVGNNGILYNATDILDTYVYRITTTQPLSMGLATATGLYQSFFGLAVVLATNAIIKHKNPEYALF